MHVQPPDTGTASVAKNGAFELSGQCGQDDLAQFLLENLISAAGVPCHSEDRDTVPEQPTVFYPPPCAPSDRSFSEFLQCHLTSLLEDSLYGKHSDSHSPYTFELPTCKGWFTVSLVHFLIC